MYFLHKSFVWCLVRSVQLNGECVEQCVAGLNHNVYIFPGEGWIYSASQVPQDNVEDALLHRVSVQCVGMFLKICTFFD